MWRLGWGRCFPPVFPESFLGRRSWSSGRCSLLPLTYWCSRQTNARKFTRNEKLSKKFMNSSRWMAEDDDLSVPWWWRCGTAWWYRKQAWRWSRTSCRWRSSSLWCPFLLASERRSYRTRLIFWPWRGQNENRVQTQLTTRNLITRVTPRLYCLLLFLGIFEEKFGHLLNNLQLRVTAKCLLSLIKQV